MELRALGLRLPRVTRTIWRIWCDHGRIVQRPPGDHVPVPRPAPLSTWQMDCKDVSSVPPDPDGTYRHVVDVLNTVDMGTSILLDAHVRPDVTTETALRAVADLVQHWGVPERVTVDRDPRFVGAAQYQRFPAPFVRFWL